MTKTKPMTDFNWGKKFTELQEKQGKLGTQKALISRSFIAHAIDQATSKAMEGAIDTICDRIEMWADDGVIKTTDDIVARIQSLKKDK